MTLSSRGHYALHAVFDLAMHHNGVPVRIGTIAKRQTIPQKFLELILSSLKQGGFVEARRGADGGYLLARRPEEITVGEVLRYVETAHQRKVKHGRADTPFSDLWQQVDHAVSGIVDVTTFAELVRKWAEKQQCYVPDWNI